LKFIQEFLGLNLLAKHILLLILLLLVAVAVDITKLVAVAQVV
jgi:hypothetical protein